MSSDRIFSPKNTRSGLIGYLRDPLGLDPETALRIFEVAGVFLLAKLSKQGATLREVELILESKIGKDIAIYTKDNFVDSVRPEVFSEKLSLSIPLFEDQIESFLELLRKQFD